MRKHRRNIIIVNNEIDYDKLEETIIKANTKTKTQKVNNSKKEEKTSVFIFFKVLYYIIFNKKNPNGTMTSGLFSSLISFFFNGLAILGLIVFVGGIIAIVNIVKSCIWTPESIVSNISAIFLLIAFLLITIVFSLLFRASANEIAKEKDRDYIVSVFSGVVSFAALIVALVALLKGVG